MRRQAGANHVEMDTVEQWVTACFEDPSDLSFEVLLDAADSAAFTTDRIEVDVEGRVVNHPCEQCGEERTFLEFSRTDQRLELQPGAWPLGPARIRGEVLGWQEGHPRIAPLPASEDVPDALP